MSGAVSPRFFSNVSMCVRTVASNAVGTGGVKTRPWKRKREMMMLIHLHPHSQLKRFVVLVFSDRSSNETCQIDDSWLFDKKGAGCA